MHTIYTICCGDRYSGHIPAALARSLEPNMLVLMTDRPASQFDRAPNLVIRWIGEWGRHLPTELSGWWWKMLIYMQHKKESHEIFFVDVDTLFLKDVSPIIKYCRDSRKSLVLPMDHIFPKLATNMIYCNYSHGDHLPAIITREFLKLKKAPPGGDQDWLNRFIGEEGLQGKVGIMPRGFCASYKLLFSDRGNWARQREKHYGDDFTVDDFIAVTFNGKPDFDEVVRSRMTGHQHFRRFLEGEGQRVQVPEGRELRTDPT